MAYGGYYYYTNYTTKTENLELFTIEVPQNVNLEKNNTTDILSYTDQKQHVVVEALDTRGFVGALAGGIINGALSESNNSNVKQINDSNLQENATLYEIHSNGSSNAMYIGIYNPQGIYILVGTTDKQKTLSMVNSIKLNQSYYSTDIKTYTSGSMNGSNFSDVLNST